MSQTSEKEVTKNDKLVKKSDKLVKKRHRLVKNNYITERKLVNLNNQISKVITKRKCLDQDARVGLQPNQYYCIEIHESGA